MLSPVVLYYAANKYSGRYSNIESVSNFNVTDCSIKELILSNEWIQNTYYIFAKCTHVYFVSRPINCTTILIETTERLIVWLSLVPFRFGLVWFSLV